MKRTPLTSKTPMRKVSKKKRAYRASPEGQAGLDYMARVAQLPCVTCGAWPVEVHHCIHDRYGTARASDMDTIPLCQPCHAELHAGKSAWREKHGPDYGFLDRVKQLLDHGPAWE